MSPPLSVYLDAVRFAAALVVLLSHLGHGHLIGGYLWPATFLGSEAVMVFFVLSGFVIAYVADRRERSLTLYASARLARLYSVILPAMLLTLVLDWVGHGVSPEAYSWSDSQSADYSTLAGYLTSLAMVNQSWSLDMVFGSNGAYWSIPYEFWYYFLFAAAVFLRGWARAGALALGALAAGPRILSLLPVWLLGVAAYRVLRGGLWAHWAHWAMLATGTLGMLAMLHIDVKSLGEGSLLGLAVDSLYWKYLFGFLFALNIAGAAGAAAQAGPMLKRLETPIRAVAGGTFALYLFHLPIVGFVEAVSPFDQRSALHWALLAGAPLFVSFTVGVWCERQKSRMRGFLVASLPADRRKGPTAVSETR